jgi:hypothetical protein
MAKTLFLTAACGILLFNLASAYAHPADSLDVVRIDNGETRLALNGQRAFAMRAWRENYNAHGFDVVTFYVRAKDEAGESLHLVPLFQTEAGNIKERYEITASGGADCQLHDFRLVQQNGQQSTRLIVADREYGDTFVSPGIVHFTYYDLAQNTDGVPGLPPLYFEARKRLDSRQVYCDVNEAFDKELHLGRTSGNGGHGPG